MIKYFLISDVPRADVWRAYFHFSMPIDDFSLSADAGAAIFYDADFRRPLRC